MRLRFGAGVAFCVGCVGVSGWRVGGFGYVGDDGGGWC